VGFDKVISKHPINCSGLSGRYRVPALPLSEGKLWGIVVMLWRVRHAQCGDGAVNQCINVGFDLDTGVRKRSEPLEIGSHALRAL
jgi:hypothetical protein